MKAFIRMHCLWKRSFAVKRRFLRGRFNVQVRVPVPILVRVPVPVLVPVPVRVPIPVRVPVRVPVPVLVLVPVRTLRLSWDSVTLWWQFLSRSFSVSWCCETWNRPVTEIPTMTANKEKQSGASTLSVFSQRFCSGFYSAGPTRPSQAPLQPVLWLQLPVRTEPWRNVFLSTTSTDYGGKTFNLINQTVFLWRHFVSLVLVRLSAAAAGLQLLNMIIHKVLSFYIMTACFLSNQKYVQTVELVVLLREGQAEQPLSLLNSSEQQESSWQEGLLVWSCRVKVKVVPFIY